MSKQFESETVNKTVYTMEDIFGPVKTKEEVMRLIEADPGSKKKYEELGKKEEMQKELDGFLMGERSLNILYDNFFRKIFNPEEHRDRVERLISALIGQKVKIKQVLSREGSQISDKGSLVIMDIIVELEDGSFVDVEMQKTGYRFPAQRSSCYASDMMMRQYNRRKSEKKDEFTYKSITPVYMFVLMENSSKEFSSSGDHFHKRQVSYSSGVELPEMVHIVYISLDTFREGVHNINDELDAWLTFLIKGDAESVMKLIEAYPEFIDIYREIAEFRRDPRELIGMFSEALLELDRNTERYMIDELKEDVEKAEVERDAAIADRDTAIADRDTAIADRYTAIADRDTAIADRDTAIADRDTAIADRDTAISSLNVERQRGDELEEKLGRYRDKFGEI
ncbi:MAG: PD-(D/E)XK nuclease family transposase [Lachnospiraceae bacterium]|nr:PD-(D/E)XK nuclease family transposase [Lachnospiraceae bacterium]